MLKSVLSASITRHPDPALQRLWTWIQWVTMLIPLHGLAFALLVVAATGRGLWQCYEPISRRWLNRGFAILGLWLVGISGTAEKPVESLVGLFNLLPFIAGFMVYSHIIRTPDQLRHLARLMVAVSGVVTLLGIGQMFGGWQGPPWPLSAILGWKIVAGGYPEGRMASVFMYANTLAGYLVMVLPLAIVLWLEQLAALWPVSTPELAPDHQSSRPSAVAISLGVALTLAVVMIFITIGATQSRNAWAIAALVSIAISLYQGWYWILALLSTVVGIVFTAAFGPVVTQAPLRHLVPRAIWARLTDQLYPNRPLPELRSSQWKFAWWMTQQRPFTGWGLRNFTPLYEAKTQLYLGHPHNIFLMLLAETGIPTTLLFCSLVGWVMASTLRLLWHWHRAVSTIPQHDRRLVVAYFMAFSSCILFNCLDVTLMDLRVNALGWGLLSALAGVSLWNPVHPDPLISDDITTDANSTNPG